MANTELNAGFSNANLKYADLSNIDFDYSNLRNANLEYANLNGVDMTLTNLSDANLNGANLNNAVFATDDSKRPKVTNAQIKSACNWQQAIYKANWKEGKWIVNEVANQRYIEQLKQDKASEPKKVVDCSRWSN